MRKGKNLLKYYEKHKKIYCIEDYIPIRDIRNGIIETTDNRYIKIIEVEPVNFMLRSGHEQNSIIYSFASWLKIAPARLQFKAITKKASSDKYVDSLEKSLIHIENENSYMLTKAYIDLIRRVGSREALTRRFFIIFEYDESLNYRKTWEYGDIYASLTNTVSTAKSYLRQCGNYIVEPDDENMFLAEVIYQFFNKKSSAEEPFQKRYNRIIRDMHLSAKRIPGVDPSPRIPVPFFIGPRGIDLTHINYMVMDGLYYTYLYITRNGYPTRVYGGWLSSIVNAGEGIDVDLFLRKEDRSSTIDKVARKIRLNASKARGMQDTYSDFEEISNAISAGYYIKQGISTGNEDFFYLSTIITITAETYDELLWRRQNVVDMLKAADIETRDCRFMIEDAFLSTMPFNRLRTTLFEKSKRNTLTTGAASTYMMTSYELCDDNGVLIGINLQNNSLCIADLFNTDVYSNANLCICGTSGSGKTYTMLLLAMRMRMLDIQTFIIAPHKGVEISRACDGINGQFIRISPSSKHCINLFDIRPTVSPDLALIDGDTVIDTSLLIKKVQSLMIFFALLIPDLTNMEEQQLDEALIEMYKEKGITTNNDSIYANQETGNLKIMPVFGDLYRIVKDNRYLERVATIIKRFVTGSFSNFNQQTNVNLDNNFIVLDLSDLENNRLLAPAMYVALDFVWDVVKSDRTKKKAIFMDELWQLIGVHSNRNAAEWVMSCFKIIRGYGGAAICSTQDLSDFFALDDGKYGKGILNVCKTKIVLNLEHEESKMVQDVFQLTDSEISNIEHFQEGEALIITNNNKIPVKIMGSAMEHDLISTRNKDLVRILQEKKQEKEAGR